MGQSFRHAALWSGGAQTDLGALSSPADISTAWAINSSGVVVGESVFSQATGINELGQIVGTATASYVSSFDPTSKSTRDFIFTLTPAVPEASTWAMMVLGLGGLVAVARRRKTRS
ncbi:PEP-CTERM sorting domain-containing protein [Aquabacterium sp.]|uniref:PEP-CTERM sorting domain-containing protein n=1 Tax=Aquabacterium sp. TaxID=1872578 RepID=UPI0024898DD2|nr:PEP-CTERM sorting domain-containing protein [Aquabacterium sp.]MDI1260952.1 PEP-CTERM sorting domain-containing protein [Aquabacterium sp.]